jgi:hypothetical protein
MRRAAVGDIGLLEGAGNGGVPRAGREPQRSREIAAFLARRTVRIVDPLEFKNGWAVISPGRVNS